MPPTLRYGDRSEAVRRLQRRLSIPDDGIFGPKTQAAVEAFQESHGLYVDGIVGPNTWSVLLGSAYLRPNHWKRVDVDKYQGGYDHFSLRDDVADELFLALQQVRALGGIITSSGSRRSLKARVNSNRSATSLHYVGRALDLYVYSSMVNPRQDPYVCVRDHGMRWQVFGRCNQGPTTTLKAYTYQHKEVEVEGQFFDLTALFKRHGFQRISARRRFFNDAIAERKRRGAAEWWHFQYETGLVEGESTFGEELLKVYRLEDVERRKVWQYRDRVWGVNWH